jgi:phosphoribosylaminoimidazole carboxylase (NCAIR synthetase)
MQAKMGVALKVLDPTPECPASVVAQQVLGSFRDREAVQQFAKDCDVLTVEIEHIDADAMQVGNGAQRPHVACLLCCQHDSKRASAISGSSGEDRQPHPSTFPPFPYAGNCLLLRICMPWSSSLCPAGCVQAVAQQSAVAVEPTPHTLRVIQDKYRQKQHFSEAGVPLCDFREVKCSKCAEGAGRSFGYPYMLKCKR